MTTRYGFAGWFGLVLLGLSACGSPETAVSPPPPAAASAAEPAPRTQEPPAFKVGPKGLPLPLDSGPPESAPGGGGKILTYQIPRGVKLVVKEQREFLKQESWTIDSDETSPRGALRLVVTKNGTTIKLSMLGDDRKTAFVVTLP